MRLVGLNSELLLLQLWIAGRLRVSPTELACRPAMAPGSSRREDSATAKGYPSANAPPGIPSSPVKRCARHIDRQHKVLVCLDRKRFEASLVDGSGPRCPVMLMPTLGVSDGQPTHVIGEVIVAFGPYNQMPVIGQHTKKRANDTRPCFLPRVGRLKTRGNLGLSGKPELGRQIGSARDRRSFHWRLAGVWAFVESGNQGMGVFSLKTKQRDAEPRSHRSLL